MRGGGFGGVLLLAALVLGSAAQAGGEFEAGLEAYDAGDPATARILWLPLAEAGHVDAQNNLGWLYEHGEGVERDLERAIEWYRRAATAEPRWAENVGRVEQALAQAGAEASARVAATREPAAPARPEAGATFEDGLAAYDRGDHAAARRIWQRLAIDGHADAQNNLGWLYEQGEGVERDRREALRWYRAAAAGDPRWADNLARLEAIMAEPDDSSGAAPSPAPAATSPGTFEDGLSAYDRGDHRGARAIWLWHAERGHVDAQNNVGWLYEQGEGGAPDLEAALGWYSAAAPTNAAAAKSRDRVQAKLDASAGASASAARVPTPARVADPAPSYAGAMALYDDRRYAEAAGQLEMLAAAGHPRAQTNLGYLYENGLGVARDDRAAREWYLTAARRGEAQAQNNLGALLAGGRGGEVDLVGAYVWFSVAGGAGHAQAKENRDALKRMLSRRELDEAERLAGERRAASLR